MSKNFFNLVAPPFRMATLVGALSLNIAWANPSERVQLESPEPGHYHITADILTDFKPSQVWAVLSDYNGIANFISFVKSSEVVEENDNALLVRQQAKGRFMLFSKTVELLLRVHEWPPTSISFQDISGKDFKEYQGLWTVIPEGGGSKIYYSLTAQRAFFAPDFIAKDLMKKNVAEYLDELQVELERRYSPVLSPGSEPKASSKDHSSSEE